jgi:hypothetical protein
MASDTSAQSKPDKQAAKLEARKERNEAQAVIERKVWNDLNAQADQAVIEAKRKQGAPSTYTVDIGNEIVTRMANGQSLNAICKLEHMPHISTVYDWCEKDSSFAAKYARARELAAHTLFSAMKDIADDDSNDLLDDGSPNNAAIQRARLRVDTYARIAGKLAPKSFGERMEAQTVTVNHNTLTMIDGQSLGADQRNALRHALIAARDSKLIDN